MPSITIWHALNQRAIARRYAAERSALQPEAPVHYEDPKCQWADEWFHVKSGRCDLDYHERHDNGSDVTNDFTGSRL